MRHDGLYILHHGIDVEVQHLVDGFRRGFGEIATDISACVAVENVDVIDLLEDLRDHGIAAVCIQKVRDLRDGALAEFTDKFIQGFLVPVDHDDGCTVFQ
ncbi:hypothetical protein D3C80_1936860 [compost metagenome]